MKRHEVRCGSRLCENSDVELARRNFVSITLNRKRTALAVTVEGGQGRKQFCAFSARARFHTAWAQSGHSPKGHAPHQLAVYSFTPSACRVMYDVCRARSQQRAKMPLVEHDNVGQDTPAGSN